MEPADAFRPGNGYPTSFILTGRDEIAFGQPRQCSATRAQIQIKNPNYSARLTYYSLRMSDYVTPCLLMSSFMDEKYFGRPSPGEDENVLFREKSGEAAPRGSGALRLNSARKKGIARRPTSQNAHRARIGGRTLASQHRVTPAVV